MGKFYVMRRILCYQPRPWEDSQNFFINEAELTAQSISANIYIHKIYSY